MKTLAVLCSIMLHGQDVLIKGNETVYKSTDSHLYVTFKAKSTFMAVMVPANDCRYLERPEQASERPQDYYPSFRPDQTEQQLQVWRDSHQPD